MITIRTRSIERARVEHECCDCGRPIVAGDPCVEASLWCADGVIWSEYTCCRSAHQIRRARRWWV